MKKLILISLIACLILGLTARTTVTNIDANRLKVVWELPDWQLTTQSDYLWLHASEMAYETVTGSPLIPYDELKAAVPPGGSVEISNISIQEETVSLEKRLLPVPEVRASAKADEYTYLINEALYSNSPVGAVVAQSVQSFRNLRFVPIRINPFIYDGNHNLKVIRQIEFTISITGDTGYQTRQTPDELTSMVIDKVLNPAQAPKWLNSTRRTVNYANFNQSDWWVKIETDKDGMYKIPQSLLSMLPVNDIDPKTLRIFTTGGEVHSGAIEYDGAEFKEIPIWVYGEADGNFDAGDYLLFYGRNRDGLEMNRSLNSNLYLNPYSQNGCYWLTFGGDFQASPLRIVMNSPESSWDDEVTTTPATVRVESDVYQRYPTGFEWFMSKMYGTQSTQYDFNISLDDVDTSQSQTLSMLVRQEYLESGSSLAHTVRLKVNGSDLMSGASPQEWHWNSLSPITISHTGTEFQSGDNDLGISVIRSRTDNLLLDYYQVAYQKNLIKRSKPFEISIPNTFSNHRVRYNFTGSATDLRIFKTLTTTSSYETMEIPVTMLSGGFSFVGSGDIDTKFQVVQSADYYTPAGINRVGINDLSQVSQPYDNVIITPAEFETQATELASVYQEKWHKSSKVVLLDDVFNQFSGGMPEPNAIREFLAYAVQNYPGQTLTSVTLLGAGTNDWRNFSGQAGDKNRMITFQRSTSSSMVPTTASDDYFVMFNTPQYPEMAIGRYPAKNENDMNVMLNNLREYAENPQPGLWQNTLLFMADDEYNGSTSGEYYHSQQMQSSAALINRGVLVDKLFTIEYDFDEFQNKPKARDDMFKSINEGKLIFYYIGHGAYDKLGSEDYLNGAVDMNKFNNTGKLPLLIASSCDVGQFDSFGFDCLGEKTVRMNNKGAIASITATRLSLAYDNVPLMNRYFEYSVNLRNSCGYSLAMAKIAYTGNNTNDEKYILLGDPLLTIIPPFRDSSIVVSTSGKDSTLHSREQVTLEGKFAAEGLSQTALIQAFNCDIIKTMENNSVYTQRGGNLFRGNSSVTNSQFSSTFIVPDDVSIGSTGLAMAYIWDASTKTGYINYLFPISLNNEPVPTENTDAPLITMYLDKSSENSAPFIPGGYVGTNPVLTAEISDLNGINTTDTPGHSLMLILDHNSQPVNVTKLFSYNDNSYTAGSLTYQFTGLKEGQHTLQLIAFDNFNRPSVSSLEFNVANTGKFAIKDLLPYPNPMKKDGWFTFVLNENATVKVSLYTIRGKKIRTITADALAGFNKIYWDGKDADGDYLANNTYFIKMTAKSVTGKSKAESIEKLVIYH